MNKMRWKYLAFLSLFFAQTDIQDPMETAFYPKNVFKNQPKSVKKTFKGRQCERSEGFQKLIKWNFPLLVWVEKYFLETWISWKHM